MNLLFLLFPFVFSITLLSMDFKGDNGDKIISATLRKLVEQGYEDEIKDKTPLWAPIIELLGGPRASIAFKNSLLRKPRTGDDYAPVYVWQYQYKDPLTNDLIIDNKPISTQREYWKSRNEARIISLTFYGSEKKYLDGIIDFLNSIQHIKKINNIPTDELWGYETFIIRIYVAQKNPLSLEPRPQKNATSPEFIEMLLERGCEIAFVDNQLDMVGRDATFWRFLVADEHMKDGQRVRYLIRDIDHKVTAAEYFSVGEWISSGMQFHRMHFSVSFIGPLTASIFGGTHEGKGGIKNLHSLIEAFPFRFAYGDDEIFTKYIIWSHVKKSNSILTHKYNRGISFFLCNLYAQSSQDEPTSAYCMGNNAQGCVDLLMPKGIIFPLIYLAYDMPLKKINNKYFDLTSVNNPRVKRAIKNLFINHEINGLPSDEECRDFQNEPEFFEMLQEKNAVLADQEETGN